MFGERGNYLILNAVKAVLKFCRKHTMNVALDISKGIRKHNENTGKKSVKKLVKRGRDIEVSEEITSKAQLKRICCRCKRAGMIFALKKTEKGNFRILYERNNSAVLKGIVASVIDKQLTNKTKLSDIFKGLENIKEINTEINEPVKETER